MVSLTNKDVEFLSNPELIKVLRSVLGEIDNVAASHAHRSTTYLAVSAIEGLFGELLTLLKLTHSTVPNWPKDGLGKPKKRKDLTLEDKEKILGNANKLPRDFESLYTQVRRYRNYMHPERELKELTPIAQSVAQLALACLNALIEKYSPQRFAADQAWSVEYGLTKVFADDVIQISPKSADKHSVLVSAVPASKFRALTFDVLMPPDTIFNFLFSYSSLDRWRAARIDSRQGRDGGLLLCSHWQAWNVIGRYTKEPKPETLKHSVVVTCDPFAIAVDGVALSLERNVDWGFDEDGQIGFMGNEKTAEELARELFDAYRKNKQTQRRMSEVLVSLFEESHSFAQAKTRIGYLEKLEVWESSFASRLRTALQTNSQVSGSWHVPERAAALIKKWEESE